MEVAGRGLCGRGGALAQARATGVRARLRLVALLPLARGADCLCLRFAPAPAPSLSLSPAPSPAPAPSSSQQLLAAGLRDGRLLLLALELRGQDRDWNRRGAAPRPTIMLRRALRLGGGAGPHVALLERSGALAAAPRGAGAATGAPAPVARAMIEGAGVVAVDFEASGRFLQAALATCELVFVDAAAGVALRRDSGGGGRHAESLRDLNWRTQTCLLGASVAGVWHRSTPLLRPLPYPEPLPLSRTPRFDEVRAVARNATGADVIATAGDDGAIRLYAFPALPLPLPLPLPAPAPAAAADFATRLPRCRVLRAHSRAASALSFTAGDEYVVSLAEGEAGGGLRVARFLWGGALAALVPQARRAPTLAQTGPGEAERGPKEEEAVDAGARGSPPSTPLRLAETPSPSPLPSPVWAASDEASASASAPASASTTSASASRASAPHSSRLSPAAHSSTDESKSTASSASSSASSSAASAAASDANDSRGLDDSAAAAAAALKAALGAVASALGEESEGSSSED